MPTRCVDKQDTSLQTPKRPIPGSFSESCERFLVKPQTFNNYGISRIMNTLQIEPNTTTPPKLLNKLQVGKILHISDRTLEKLVKSSKFPRPLQLGRTVFWDEPVVLNWLNSKLTAQRAWQPKGQRPAAGLSGLPFQPV